MTDPSRVQPGVPAGGQFAETRKPASGVSLPIGAADGGDPWAAVGLTDEAAQAWSLAGFDEPEDAADWSQHMPPDDAALWRSAGFDAGAAGDWEQFLIAPHVAREFIDEGIHEPGDAIGFIETGIAADDAKEWTEALESEHGIEREHAGTTAADWLHRGFDLETARRWMRAGITHAGSAAEWERRSFEPAAAREWDDASFGPEEAAEWRGEALTAEQADYYATRGLDPAGARRALPYASRAWGAAAA